MSYDKARHREISRLSALRKRAGKRTQELAELEAQLPDWCKPSDLQTVTELYKAGRFGLLSKWEAYALCKSGEIQCWQAPTMWRLTCDRAIALYFDKIGQERIFATTRYERNRKRLLLKQRALTLKKREQKQREREIGREIQQLEARLAELKLSLAKNPNASRRGRKPLI